MAQFEKLLYLLSFRRSKTTEKSDGDSGIRSLDDSLDFAWDMARDDNVRHLKTLGNVSEG